MCSKMHTNQAKTGFLVTFAIQYWVHSASKIHIMLINVKIDYLLHHCEWLNGNHEAIITSGSADSNIEQAVPKTGSGSIKPTRSRV